MTLNPVRDKIKATSCAVFERAREGGLWQPHIASALGKGLGPGRCLGNVSASVCVSNAYDVSALRFLAEVEEADEFVEIHARVVPPHLLQESARGEVDVLGEAHFKVERLANCFIQLGGVVTGDRRRLTRSGSSLAFGLAVIGAAVRAVATVRASRTACAGAISVFKGDSGAIRSL